MNFARLFPAPVTLVRLDWIDQRGARVPGPSPVETLAMAAVQPIRSDRRILHDLPSSVAAHTVHFASDPRLGVDDRVLWRGKTLRVLAPARDQAGRGVVWSLDAAEVESEADRA